MTNEQQLLSLLIEMKSDIKSIKTSIKKMNKNSPLYDIQDVEEIEVDLSSFKEEDIDNLDSEFVTDYTFRQQVKAYLDDNQRPQYYKASILSKQRGLETVTFINPNPKAKVKTATGYKRDLLESIYGIDEVWYESWKDKNIKTINADQ